MLLGEGPLVADDLDGGLDTVAVAGTWAREEGLQGLAQGRQIGAVAHAVDERLVLPGRRGQCPLGGGEVGGEGAGSAGGG
ncbi:hypothetical protein HEP87_60545 [Streptomyces sp. S1D4-11]